jgi:hypothetical protein
MSGRGLSNGGDIDFNREEQIKKGNVCIEKFKAVWQFPSIRKLAERQSEVFNNDKSRLEIW